VTFFEGSTELGRSSISSEGVATLSVSFKSTGSGTVTAVYSGDVSSAASTSKGVGVTVGADQTRIALVTSAATVVVGQRLTLKATVWVAVPGAGAPTGSVTFMDGSTVIDTVPLSGGKAILTTAFAITGSHTITALYSGDGNDNSSTSTASAVQVNTDTTGTAVTLPATAVVWQSVDLVARVTVKVPGAGIPTGSVMFVEGTTVLGTVRLSGTHPSATLPWRFATPGVHSITAVYLGDANDATSTGTGTVSVSKDATTTSLASSANTAVYGLPVTFTAGVTVNSPGAGTPTGSVRFMDGSTILATVRLVAGAATYTTSALTRGAHVITAVYVGDADDKASTSATLTQTID
jgi:hypothetical protein